MKPDEPSTGVTTATPPSTPMPDNPSPKNRPLSYYNSLPLEETHNAPGQPQPQVTPAPTVEAPQKKKHPIRRTVILVLAIVVLIGTVTFIYTLGRKISVSELVTENTEGTTYLRPHQWKPIQADNATGYGDRLAKDGKSTAAVYVSKTGGNLSSLAANDGEDGYPLLRQQVINTPSIGEGLPSLLKAIGAECDAKDIKTTKEIDTTSTATTIGIYKMSATCSLGKGKPTIKIRGVLGKDGYVRTIGLIAPERDWQLSAEAFQKMLDSLAQAE